VILIFVIRPHGFLYVCKTFWLRTKIDICRSRSHYVFVYFIIIRFVFQFRSNRRILILFYNNMVYRIISKKLNVSIIWLLNWVPVRSKKLDTLRSKYRHSDTKRRSYIGRLTQWILADYDTPGDPFALAIGKLFPKELFLVPLLRTHHMQDREVSKADIAIFRTSYHLR
jgi:hypothetical protein